MSERSLIYSDEPLMHRTLVIAEAAGMQGDFGSYAIRSLLSEGRLRYETVERTREGFRPRKIDRKGPTGLLVTTTAIKLHPENETRILSIPVTDTQEQTRQVILRCAQSNVPPNYGPWRALQEWLAIDPPEVDIPYARALADLTNPVAVRLRRDFRALLSLVRSHALLHRASRGTDAQGRIVATPADYEAVRALLADLIAEGAETSVSATVRETVEAVKEHAEDGDKPMSVRELAQVLQLDKSAASRRARAALEAGFVRNLEDRRGRPAQYVLGEPMPDEIEILPDVAALRDRCSVDCVPEEVGDPPERMGRTKRA